MVSFLGKLGLLSTLATSILAFQGAEEGQQQFLAAASTLIAAHPTVTAQAGTIIGTTTVVSSATSTVTVGQYLGIPYAQPIGPAGRFSPPTAAKPFNTPLVAQSYGPACFQEFKGVFQYIQKFSRAVFGGQPQFPPEAEDCLYLNIFSPQKPGANKTVMFWIFGGGLTFGHAGQALYDGSNLAANQDVVVVTINYRTNVFGFSNSPAIPSAENNAGFWDQRLALEWVHNNIASFGGNPANVTLFGQSAGAKSADRLVLNPPFPGAFSAAILQSDVATFGTNLDQDDDEFVPNGPPAWGNLTTNLGCHRIHKNAELACMRSTNPSAASVIQSAVQAMATEKYGFVQFTDNITKLSTPVNRTKHQSVPILLGSNGQEARVLRVGYGTSFDDYVAKLTDDPDYTESLTQAYGPVDDQTSDYDAISNLETEMRFLCPVAFTSNDSIAAKKPTWRYIFNASFPSTNMSAALQVLPQKYRSTDLEAFHTSEIAYVFGNLPPGSSPDQFALSASIQSAWANFAKDPYGKGPGWAQADQGVMVFGGKNSAATTFVDGFSLDSNCQLFQNHLYGGSGDDDQS